MTTRQDLRNLIRRRLGDTSTPFQWSDLQVNQWINDAIAEHSIHFPRKLDTTLNCVTDDKAYDLPVNFKAAMSVEYPANDDPPKYLIRRSFSLWGSSDIPGFYDIIRRDDATDFPELWISEKPTTGEDIIFYYLGNHASLDDDTDVCTVPDVHLELLVLFVRWATYQELASKASADPDPTSLAMGTLELNAFRANREYRTKLKQWLAAESESNISSWTMDKYDQVY